MRSASLPCENSVEGSEICAERDFFIDNLLVRIHFIIEMIRWTGLAPCNLPSQSLFSRISYILRRKKTHAKILRIEANTATMYYSGLHTGRVVGCTEGWTLHWRVLGVGFPHIATLQTVARREGRRKGPGGTEKRPKELV